MATKTAKLEAAPAETASAPKKKGKLLFIILGLLLVGGGVAGWWFFLKPKPPADAAAAAAAKAAAAPRAPALYFKYDPAFVVNFGSEGNARYLQVMVEAMTRDAPTLDLIKNNEPAERNDLVVLFSSQTDATLATSDGREKLRAACLEAVRKVIGQEGGKPEMVESVYFTSFVVQ